MNTSRQPPSSSSATRSWQQQQQQQLQPPQQPSSDARPTGVYTLHINDFLINLVHFVCEWTRACCRLWWRLLTTPTFQDNELLRISIALLTLYTIHPYMTDVDVDSNSTLLPRSIYWAIPMATTVLLLLACFLWAFQQRDALMVTGLLTLFLLEAMLPIVMLTSISLLVMQQVSVVSASLALVINWCSVNCMAHFIRCFLYQNAGHDG
jgi:hypothetical protein